MKTVTFVATIAAIAFVNSMNTIEAQTIKLHCSDQTYSISAGQVTLEGVGIFAGMTTRPRTAKNIAISKTHITWSVDVLNVARSDYDFNRTTGTLYQKVWDLQSMTFIAKTPESCTEAIPSPR